MTTKELSPDEAPPRVLVVDDDAMLRNLLFDVLSHEGYTVDVASDGEDALRRLDTANVDLVITDVVMPGMSGVDVLRNARRRYPDLDVIVMTGYASVDTAIRSIRLGAVDYITKPFNIEHIRVLVAKTIELARLRKLQRQAEESSDLAGIDISTGLYNRRLFLDLLQGEIISCARSQQPLSLIIVSLADCGETSSEHAEHDWSSWITLVSWALRQSVRPVDRLGRLGPTCFGIALPDIGQVDVLFERDRLQQIIYRELQTRTSSVRVTTGMATYPTDAQDLPGLLGMAERAAQAPRGALGPADL